MSVATIRAFLAVEVPPPIDARLVALKRELAAARADVRWVRDDGLHATVKFLGRVDPARLAALRVALTPPLAAGAVIPARVRGLGAFPSLRRPRALWVGLEAPALADLARGVDAVAARFGFAPEARPFHPHVTLGRVHGSRGWGRLEDALKLHWTDDYGVFEIGALAAFRSDLRPDGAVYARLWTIPLGASRGGDDGS
jgi:2'-5' RNA ligase